MEKETAYEARDSGVLHGVRQTIRPADTPHNLPHPLHNLRFFILRLFFGIIPFANPIKKSEKKGTARLSPFPYDKGLLVQTTGHDMAQHPFKYGAIVAGAASLPVSAVSAVGGAVLGVIGLIDSIVDDATH